MEAFPLTNLGSTDSKDLNDAMSKLEDLFNEYGQIKNSGVIPGARALVNFDQC